MYYLEAKISSNTWVAIDELYFELVDFQSGYTSIVEASKAKGKVKNYLKIYKSKNKVPIRIVEIK